MSPKADNVMERIRKADVIRKMFEPVDKTIQNLIQLRQIPHR